MEEERRSKGEQHSGQEKEKEELRTKLSDATKEVRGQFALEECVILPEKNWLDVNYLSFQICRLESVIQQQDRKEKAVPNTATLCGAKCSRLEDELHQTWSRLARIQEEAERQRDKQQREIASLRADKHRLEEKVLEQSRVNAERSLLDQSQRQAEDRIR